MSTFIHEALVTELADDTWSVPSGDNSQRKHTLCSEPHGESFWQRRQAGPWKMS